MSYYLNKLRKALDKLIWGWMLCFLVIISHVWHVRCCSCNSCLSLILFACLLKLAHDLHSYGCSVVTLCLSCLLFLMHCLLYLCAFIHPHWCISFRYARWTTRGHEARDDGTEPQDGVGGRVLKRKEPAGATEEPTQSRKGPRPC